MTGKHRARRRRPGLAVLLVAGAAAAVVALAPTASAGPTPAGSDVVQMLRVSTPQPSDRVRLAALGVDLTESGGPGYLDVLVYSPAQANLLRANGFRWTVRVADVAAEERARREADRQFQVSASPLPSGRTTYRTLADYGTEMTDLAKRFPNTAKLISLPGRTLEGRVVQGLEITHGVAAADGKPVMLIMGLHHAREWPSGELTMEFVNDLLRSDGTDPRITGLLDRARVVAVPVVNPDGFEKTQSLATMEYKRKNCRVLDLSNLLDGLCGLGLSPVDLSQAETGVDPNRNYGGNWGGPGASGIPLDLTYRGAGPFSEPETQNIRALVSGRQVTTLITNHTFSNLVLRPPGLASTGDTPDEPLYKALGDLMAAQNGYTSEKSYQLYDTSGTTEDWSYYATGGLGFTFEIGADSFHPEYAKMPEFYFGDAAHAGKGNREAWLLALESTVDTTRHATLTGAAPPGAVLRLYKEFQTPNNDGTTFTDRLNTTTVVPGSGVFSWHVNQSTRPLAVKQGKTEQWRLTCERPDGTVLQTVPVTVGRGEQQNVNLDACKAAYQR